MDAYEETVTFHPVMQLLYLGGIGVVAWSLVTAASSAPWISVLVGVFLLALPLVFGRLTIRIDAAAHVLVAEFGYLGWPIQRIPLGNIIRASTVSYHPIRQFGGWGLRRGRLDGAQTSVYSVRGTTGVLIELSEEQRISGWRTKRFLLGSAEPDRLSAAIGKPSETQVLLDFGGK